MVLDPGSIIQRQIVQTYVKNIGNTIVCEYTEIKSGKNNQRPQLLKAITIAKETGAILCIAKLDRSSRSISFISNLMESKVQFVALDIPFAAYFKYSLEI